MSLITGTVLHVGAETTQETPFRRETFRVQPLPQELSAPVGPQSPPAESHQGGATGQEVQLPASVRPGVLQPGPAGAAPVREEGRGAAVRPVQLRPGHQGGVGRAHVEAHQGSVLHSHVRDGLVPGGQGAEGAAARLLLLLATVDQISASVEQAHQHADSSDDINNYCC